MKNCIAIVQKELKHYFVSPIAYVVITAFLIFSGYFFYTGILRFVEMYESYRNMAQMTQNAEALEQFNLNDMVIAPALFNMIFVFLFLMPLIMMRSFAEEKRQKTDELLFTSPISINELIAGKFIGALLFCLIMISPTVIYQVLLFRYTSPEWGPVVTGYLGVILFSAAAISIGMFASSLTENQIIAAVITFLILLFMFIINFVGQKEGNLFFSILQYFSVSDHIRNLLRGLIDTRDAVYFLSISVLFLFLTKISIESMKWRSV